MSLEALIANQALGKQSNNQLLDAVVRLESAILRQVKLRKQPSVILRSSGANLSSNVADGVIILESARTPANTKIVIEDFNINFTTAAGTIRVVVLDSNGNEVNNILRDVSSSTNGTGSTVLETGDRLAVVGQTAGAGTFGCYFSGYSQVIQ